MLGLAMGLSASGCADVSLDSATNDGSDDAKPELGSHKEELVYIGCSNAQIATLDSARVQARGALYQGASAILTAPNSAAAQLAFGPYNQQQRDSVALTMWFSGLMMENDSFTRFICDPCPGDSRQARVPVGSTTDIQICPSFWSVVPRAAEIIVHEATHLVGTTDDICKWFVDVPSCLLWMSANAPEWSEAEASAYQYYVAVASGWIPPP